MALRYYPNYITHLARTPNEEYREILQETINSRWEDTTLKVDIYEESALGSFIFNKIEAWVETISEFILNFPKNETDFRKIIFKDCTHSIGRGRYYKFDDNYWIVYEQTSSVTPTGDISVRRCNNIAKWVDPINGKVYEYPCVIGEELGSPKMKSTKDDNTPNGSITVFMQGNENVHKIEKNQRFIFNGTPYKFMAYNNYMQKDYVSKDVPLLFMDLYLDQILPSDDVLNNIANKTDYVYTLDVIQGDSSQLNGFSGKLSTDVKLNSEIVSRSVEWTSNEFATVDINGNYTLNGEVGDVAIIKANIQGNADIYDEVNITIVDSIIDKEELIINPIVSELNQGQSVTFNCSLYKNDVIQNDVINYTASGASNNNYSITRVGNDFTLRNIKMSSTDLTIDFDNGEIRNMITIKLKALF